MRRYEVAHRKRLVLSRHHPVHVVLRVARSVPWQLRTGPVSHAMRNVLAHYLGRDDFRVCHLSIQHNHLHFLVEAADTRALTLLSSSWKLHGLTDPFECPGPQ
jgi:REP element-mobilizing transposase RayT